MVSVVEMSSAGGDSFRFQRDATAFVATAHQRGWGMAALLPKELISIIAQYFCFGRK